MIGKRTEADALRAFRRDRKAALLSLDEAVIRRYLRRYGGSSGPTDPEVFWAGVHKARAALAALPEEAREQSRTWLKEHGFSELS